MNRLVLIGNGFDIANGLPTRYSDFLTNYTLGIFNGLKANASNDKVFGEDNHLKVVCSESFYRSLNFDNANDFFEKINNEQNPIKLRMEFKNSLLQDLFRQYKDTQWMDIEYQYYSRIIGHISKWRSQTKSKSATISKIKEENKWLVELKILLESYLSKNVHISEIALNDTSFFELFTEPVTENNLYKNNIASKPETSETNKVIFTKHPDKVKYLNFNYTNTLTRYLVKHRAATEDIINIHGQLNDEIIFGFGDEYDSQYSATEEINNNVVFENIKSFKYFKSNSYGEIVRFIESDDYEVYIFGHSCGLSDRTLLKYLFEHPHCTQIKIFPINEKDYEDKTMEISRHFSNKIDLRLKIVNFERSELCPQPGSTAS